MRMEPLMKINGGEDFLDCEHDFELKETIKKVESNGPMNEYKKIDVFYCRKCLEQRESIEIVSARNPPDWY